MKDKRELHCSECGAPIKDTCFICLDECLIVNFFDSEKENCFCSDKCFCKYMSLKKIKLEDGSINVTGQEEV